MTLLFAFLIGLFAGLRSLTPPAAVAWAVYLGWLRLAWPLSLIGSLPAVIILSLLAITELIVDKLPNTPNRTAPPGLIARIATGGFTGACVALGGGQSAFVGAGLGLIGGIVGCFGGYQARAWLVKSLRQPDFNIALLEDLIAIAGSLFTVSRFVRLSVVVVLLTLVTTHAIAQTESLPGGQIVDRIETLNDSSQSYALYLPSNYTPDRKWPILYAFDPGARGRVPVERFKEAAEKYGWIVVGSNNSRNGPWIVVVNAWNAMLKDTHQRFAIDDKRMYAAGFSGGARVAVNIASGCKCLAGVIASGAGFPVELAPTPQMRFVFFGAAGVDDFNYPELQTLQEPLAKAGIIHRVQTFEGRHEWPPAPVATAAVEWMELHAINAGERPRDEGFINAMWQQLLNEAKTLEESKKYNEAYQLYLDMAQSFKGLRDVAEIETKVKQLGDSREVKTAIREEQEQIRKQRELMSRLNSLIAERDGGSAVNQAEDAFGTANLLPKILNDLRKQSKASDDSSQRRVARRVLDGLFVGLIEQGISLLQTEKNSSGSIKLLKLATEVNPDRPGAFFYLAWAYAANRDKKKSLQSLSTAVEKGFSDAAMITANKAFDSLRNDPEYQQIMARLSERVESTRPDR